MAEHAPSTSRRLASGAFWSLLGTLTMQGFGLVAAVVTARLLGRTGFGEWGILHQTVVNWAVLAGLGLGLSATRFIAEHRHSDPARAGRSLRLARTVSFVSGSLAMILVLVLAPWIAGSLFKAPHLTADLRLASVLLLSNALVGTWTQALLGFEAFRTLFWINATRGGIAFVVTLVGVWTLGLTGAIVGAIVGTTTGLLLARRAVLRLCAEQGVPTDVSPDAADRRTILTFTVPSVAATVLVGPGLWLAQTILVRVAGFWEMGLLNATGQWRGALLLLPQILQSVALPLLSSTLGRPDEGGEWGGAADRFGRLAAMTHDATVVGLFISGGILMMGAAPLAALYGQTFVDGDAVFVVTFGAVMLQSVGTVFIPIVQARSRAWLALYIHLLWLAALLAVVIATAQRLGALSVPLGLAVGGVALSMSGAIVVHRHMPKWFVLRVLAALLWAGITTWAAYLASPTQRLWAGPVWLLVTLALLAGPLSHPLSREALRQWWTSRRRSV